MISPLTTPDGRRAGAFLAIVGGCIAMTIMAAFGVYLVAGNAKLSFWLAMAAHLQIVIGMTGLAALFVRRTIRVNKDGVEITDHDGNNET